MTSLVLLDHAPGEERCDTLAPITTARPLSEVRAGARLIRERWECALGARVTGMIAGARHRGFTEPGAVPVLDDSEQLPAGTIVARSHFAPHLSPLPGSDAGAWMFGDHLVAMVLAEPSTVARVRATAMRVQVRAAPIDGWMLERPWDLIGTLPAMLAADAARITAEMATHPLHPDIRVIGSHAVRLASTAVIEPFVVFDATQGAIVIESDAHVRSFSRIAGPFVLGPRSQWMGGSGSTVSVGDNCRVSGEVSTTIFCGHANKGHDGFVGHSYLGRWTNLGAGTVTSNLKNTYGPVSFAGVDTGLQFLGSLIGDHAKTGILTRLTTGSSIGAGANVISDDVVPNVLPAFAWGSQGERYELSRFLQTAERVMARRQVVLDAGMRECLTAIWHGTLS